MPNTGDLFPEQADDCMWCGHEPCACGCSWCETDPCSCSDEFLGENDDVYAEQG